MVIETLHPGTRRLSQSRTSLLANVASDARIIGAAVLLLVLSASIAMKCFRLHFRGASCTHAYRVEPTEEDECDFID